MPVILPPAEYARWLGETPADVEALTAILRPSPAGDLVAYPVDRRSDGPIATKSTASAPCSRSGAAGLEHWPSGRDERQARHGTGRNSMSHATLAGAVRLILSLCMALAVVALAPASSAAQGAGAEIKEMKFPRGLDVFNLNLAQTQAFSSRKNFEVVGHSYFKGPWLAPSAQAEGRGAGFNSLRVLDGIGYFAGYNTPQTLFGVTIADVRDPSNMQVLSFIPCNPGTRCPYIRVNHRRKILVGTHDRSNNPIQPPTGQPARAGVSFDDVSDPRNPRPLGFFLTANNGSTHGFDIDDRFVYTCASTPQSKAPVAFNQEVVIIDYNNPRAPVLASTVHIPGNHVGETFGPMDDLNPDGTPQANWCHEIHVHNGRLYVAWRDAGLVIIDVANPYSPSVISRLDYVPPFNGQGIGAAHTSAPVVVEHDKHPTLVVHTDELFGCPPGFGRIIDVSDLSNPQVISSYRLPHVADVFDFETGRFVCPGTVQSIHHVWFDFRSPSLFYQAWYDQGLRVWDISNPFLPREVGYYLSPPYVCHGSCGGIDPNGMALRHTREAFQDPDTGLLYVTDGNGGGITVLRWTGPIPAHRPIPGAR